MKQFIYKYLPLLFFLFLLFLWELIVSINLISRFILPTPSAVVMSLINNWDILLRHTYQTMLEAGIGLLIACVLGVLFAIILFLSSFVRKATYPLLVISQNIPIIALAPLLLIWFGFGLAPKVIVVVLYCFFPITITLVDSLMRADPEFVDLLRSMGASKLQILRKVRIPQSIPAFFSSLRIAATYSVIAAIIGEFVGAEKGLGIFMITMAHAHAITLVFVGIFMTIILSLLLVGLVGFVEKSFFHKYFTHS